MDIVLVRYSEFGELHIKSNTTVKYLVMLISYAGMLVKAVEKFDANPGSRYVLAMRLSTHNDWATVQYT
jgi:hypothetical protein